MFLWCDHCFCSTSQLVDSDGRRHFNDLGHWDATSHEEMQKGKDCSASDLMILQKFLVNIYKIRIFL